MKTIRGYIEEAGRMTGSDRQTALRLGCSPQFLSAVKNGRKGLGDKYSFLLAEILKTEPALVIAAAQHDATNEKKFWREQWEKIAGAVAGFAVAVAALPLQITDALVIMSTQRSGQNVRFVPQGQPLF